jgi:hypothetical protein
MKKILAASACICATVAAQTAFADLRIMGNGGYLKLTSEGINDWKPEYAGFDGALRAQYDVFSPVPGLSLFAGVGLGQMLTIYKETYLGLAYDVTYQETYIPAEVGVQFSLIPMLRLQAAAQYQHGLNGETGGSVGGVDLAKHSMDSSSRVLLTGRALLTVAPFISAGIYGDVLASGKLKIENSDSANWDSGFEGGAVVALSF